MTKEILLPHLDAMALIHLIDEPAPPENLTEDTLQRNRNRSDNREPAFQDRFCNAAIVPSSQASPQSRIAFSRGPRARPFSVRT